MSTPVSAGERFERELDRPPPPELRGPEMLAVRLARACATALAVDGAGLSLHERTGLRTPIGASDAVAAQAERLQFTHGTGPCLRAHDDGVIIAFDEADIARNWPALHDSLVTQTPFRGVLSVPLLPPLGPSIVLDLYVRDPAALPRTHRDDVEDVNAALTGALVDALLGTPVTDKWPAWWGGPAASRRARVWQATGMVNVALGLNTEDALAVLKAHAFATGRVVDDVADDLVTGRLDLDSLRSPEDTDPVG